MAAIPLYVRRDIMMKLAVFAIKAKTAKCYKKTPLNGALTHAWRRGGQGAITTLPFGIVAGSAIGIVVFVVLIGLTRLPP